MDLFQDRPDLDAYWKVSRLDSVDSTNRYAMEAAASGAEPGLVVVTDHQVEGRGRRDRRWDDEPGSSLLFSVLLDPALEVAVIATRAMALSVRDASATTCGVDVQLKWPNDVLVNERKLAGILAETSTTASRLSAVVVGCGINVTSAPEGATCLARASGAGFSKKMVDKTELLTAILVSLKGWVTRADEVPSAFHDACVTLDRKVRVELATSEFVGTAVDIKEGGALVVEDESGVRQSFDMGDVVHLDMTQGTDR